MCSCLPDQLLGKSGIVLGDVANLLRPEGIDEAHKLIERQSLAKCFETLIGLLLHLEQTAAGQRHRVAMALAARI